MIFTHLFLTDAAGVARLPIHAAPGGQVQLIAWVFSPTAPVVGMDLHLSAPGFTFIAATPYPWSPWPDPLTTTPTLTSDLGATADAGPVGQGVWPVDIVTLKAPAAPGLYSIGLEGCSWVDVGFNDQPFAGVEGIGVAVGTASIPEPVGLLAFLGVGLLGRRRR